jgi:hypothetical protein
MQPDLLLVSESILTALCDLRPLLIEVPITLQEFISGMNVDKPRRVDPPKDPPNVTTILEPFCCTQGTVISAIGPAPA